MQAFINLLQQMHAIQAFIVIPGILSLLVYFSAKIRLLLGLKLSDQTSDGAFDAFNSVGVFFVFTLAFSLSIVFGYMRSADDITQKEATKINILDRYLARMDRDRFAEIRSSLRAYGEKIIAVEWPLLESGQRSDEVDALYSDLSRRIRAMEPEGKRQEALFNAMLPVLDELADIREARIGMANLHLARVYWYMILNILLLMFVLSALAAPYPGKRIALAGRMFSIGLILTLVIQIDGTFSGDIKVNPDQLRQSLNAMAAR